jgi:hypothetical protein
MPLNHVKQARGSPVTVYYLMSSNIPNQMSDVDSVLRDLNLMKTSLLNIMMQVSGYYLQKHSIHIY